MEFVPFYTLEDLKWDKNNINIVEDTLLVMSSSVDIAQQSDRRSSACTTSKDDLGFTAPLVSVRSTQLAPGGCGVPVKPSFSSLPLDIVNHILSYNGTLKHRNGKYMGQISKTDKRYELLLKIPRTFYYIWPNYYYILRVNDILTIKIYYYLQPLRYTYIYFFFGKSNAPYYTPK